MSELKAFTFGLGQYTEDGSPCVVAFDGKKNPRLASDEKFYLKSEADKVIAEKDTIIEEQTKEIKFMHQHCKYGKHCGTSCAQIHGELMQATIEIADLKEKNKRLSDDCLIKASNTFREIEKEIRHQKYKRCLAMAKWCKAEQTYSSFAIYITEHPESRWTNKSVGAGNWIAFWKNREQRLLELADKYSV